MSYVAINVLSVQAEVGATLEQWFADGHATQRPEGERPAATGSTLWAFEVVPSS